MTKEVMARFTNDGAPVRVFPSRVAMVMERYPAHPIIDRKVRILFSAREGDYWSVDQPLDVVERRLNLARMGENEE
jgi:hypothetical protein